MKTLDEVINSFELCNSSNALDCLKCPYYDNDKEIGCRSDDKEEDALQYLKEYRTFLQLSSINNEVIIKETASTYKIELTKPEFKNIIIE